MFIYLEASTCTCTNACVGKMVQSHFQTGRLGPRLMETDLDWSFVSSQRDKTGVNRQRKWMAARCKMFSVRIEDLFKTGDWKHRVGSSGIWATELRWNRSQALRLVLSHTIGFVCVRETEAVFIFRQDNASGPVCKCSLTLSPLGRWPRLFTSGHISTCPPVLLLSLLLSYQPCILISVQETTSCILLQ